MTFTPYSIGAIVTIAGAGQGRDGEWEVRYAWTDSMGQHYTLARPGQQCGPSGGVVVTHADLVLV